MADVTQARFITVTTVFADRPFQRAGFGPLLIADQANGTTLDGDRVRLYTSYAGVAADVASSFISAGVGQWAQDAFSQSPSPTKLLIGRVDTGGAETYSDALTAILADGVATPNGVRQFYMVAIESRADADILSITSATESDGRLMAMFQSDDSDWLTASLPAGLTALATRESAAGIYHTTDTEAADLCYMVRGLAADPDIKSGSWSVQCAEVLAYSTAPTETQVTNLENNFINFGLPLGAEVFFVQKGTNMVGREIRAKFSADWYAIRLQEDTEQYVLLKGRRNEPIPLNDEGKAAVEAIIRKRYQIGVDAGHFFGGDNGLVINSITVNTSTRTIAVDHDIRLLGSAVAFSFTVNFTSNALA